MQFGKRLVEFQIVQERLVKMLAEIVAMQLYCLRTAQLIEKGAMSDTIASVRLVSPPAAAVRISAPRSRVRRCQL